MPVPVSERAQAVLIANKALDRVRADPDDDLAILARQFLRGQERESALNSMCLNLVAINDGVIGCLVADNPLFKEHPNYSKYVDISAKVKQSLELNAVSGTVTQ